MIAIVAGLLSLGVAIIAWDFPRCRDVDAWRWYAGMIAYIVGLALALYGISVLGAGHAARSRSGRDGGATPVVMREDAP